MEKVAVDCGGRGDCGFLSIIAGLINQAAPPLLWADEVQGMRELIGSYWDLKDPPAPLDPFLNIEQDPMFPKQDIRERGVYMQDRDLIVLIHLMDLKGGVRVNDQLFTQDIEWGVKIREILSHEIEVFWDVAWALRSSTVKDNPPIIIHLYHDNLHFMAYLQIPPLAAAGGGGGDGGGGGGSSTNRPSLLPRPPSFNDDRKGGGGDYYY